MLHGENRLPDILIRFVGSDWPELEALVSASMRGYVTKHVTRLGAMVRMPSK